MSHVTFDFSLLRVVVSKICQDVGWHTTHVSALDVLSNLLSYYIRQVSIAAIDYANHDGRAQPSIDDLAMAFNYLSIDMSQLQDFVLNVEASPLPFSIPFYPLPCRQSRHFDNCDSDSERPEYYDEWLPSLNLKKIFNTEISENNILKDIEKPNGKCDEIPAICDKPAANVEPEFEKVVDEKDKPDKAAEENVENKEIQDDKKKLVLRFSLSKSFEDQAETTQTNEADASQTNQTTSASIASRLMASRAFNKFIQSSLYKNPESSDIKNGLRAPDTQRLINTHESRENSPEPDPLSNSCILNGDINANDPMKLPELHDNKKSKKFLLKSRKKNRSKGFDDSNFDLFNDGFKPNIKVKELGMKKKLKKLGENGEKRKKIKKFKDGIKPLSIKVTGFGFTENDEKSIGDEFGDHSNENTPKKRQYKKKDRPKDYVERRGRKPKGQSVKTTLQLGNEFANLEDGELPPSPSSFDAFSSHHSRSITPTKLKKSKNNEIFGDTEAAKMLVLMSESSENLKDEDPKRKDDELPSSDNDDLIGDLNDSKSSKKSARPAVNKRIKSNYKKTVKSAETVESSDDSSSDNEPSIHSVAVSLPPPPSEASIKSIEIAASSSNLPSRKRRHSGSSVSSVSSIHSSISASSISKRASSIEHSLIGLDILKQEKHKSKLSKPESTEIGKVKESKHKKNKKHSKEKHRHEDKSHKKHKKPKLDKEAKEKHKDKEKSFKPKLSIKLGPNLDIKRPDDFVPINESIVVPPIMETSSVSLFTESNDIDIDLPKYIVEKSSEDSVKSKKKRGPKKKILSEPKSELVFIKDTSSKTSSKELKIKTPIINVQSKLFDDVSSFDKITKPSAKLKVKEPKLNKDLELFKKEIKLPEEKTKAKKEKDLPGLSIVLKTTEDKPKKDKAKDDSRKEHSTKKITKQQEENKSCIVIRETIPVENADEEKVWICPQCKCIDDGTPMIGCDTCDDWYHYKCVGIRHEPKEDESWFCPKCIERQKQEQKKIEKMLKKKEKRVKMEKIQDSVTITPIPNISVLDPSIPVFGPGVSFLPTFAPSTSSRQPSLTITPSTYKPTGRPRGRPRKDSSLSRQPNVTITPIGPSSFEHYNDPNLMFFQQAPSTSSQAFSFTPHQKEKKSKTICLQCNISDDKSPMMLCDQCRHWYHWACVGITSAPSPGVKWLCLKCKKKKSSKQQHKAPAWDEGQDDSDESEGTSLTDAKFRALTGGLAPSGANRRFQSPARRQTTEDVEVPDSFQNQLWRCGTCQEVSTSDDSISWIACDECDQWYHFVCEGVTKAPDDNESWFCNKCIQKQKNIASKIAKIKRI